MAWSLGSAWIVIHRFRIGYRVTYSILFFSSCRVNSIQQILVFFHLTMSCCFCCFSLLMLLMMFCPPCIVYTCFLHHIPVLFVVHRVIANIPRSDNNDRCTVLLCANARELNRPLHGTDGRSFFFLTSVCVCVCFVCVLYVYYNVWWVFCVLMLFQWMPANERKTDVFMIVFAVWYTWTFAFQSPLVDTIE